jgi:lipoprotein-anchoring transpeptidase ErfK/SrfK
MRRNGTANLKATARNKWALLATTLLMATAEATTQEKPTHRAAPAAQGATNSPRRIVVSIPDCKLALVENGRVVKIYRVAVGAQVSPRPSGEFKITQRLVEPTYYAPGVVIPPGKDNPLGTRWLGLSRKGFGIHGTNQPGSVGRRASHGCIRMRNRDMEELFELVRAGDVVELHADRTTELARLFGGDDAPAEVAAESAPVGAAANGGQN